MRPASAAGFAPVQAPIRDQRSTPGAPPAGARRRSTTASEPSRRLRPGCGHVYRASSPRRATGQERRRRSPCREFVMANKMLIDASHPEETRVVVVRGQKVEEFDFETAQRKQLRGNIYLAKVTRVEPSLQAAFVEYGGNRHGFLAFSEIHPDYYQIPVADRQALIEAEEQAHREAEEESENRSQGRRRSRHRNSRRRSHGERVRSEVVEGDPAARQVQGEALPEGASHEGEHLHADAEHHGEHEGHDHHGHEAHDHEGHDHDDHHHAHGDDHHVHEHHDHDHDGEHDHHDHDHADETPAPVAAIGAEPAVATEAVAEPQEFASDAHADDLAEAVTSAAEPADAVYAAGESAQAPHHDSEATAEDDDEDEDDEEAEEDVVESVGGDDVLEEVPERTFRPRRQYKIQEVIKRRQVMLVQVVKEERGNKGAALTTYLSLAGRYGVLMPNTARGGGISRKITAITDRKRLKTIVQSLEVPQGMGLIVRTAGAKRTKAEIKRDYEYLLRLWENIRETTLHSIAPALIYEEEDLVKRAIRDLYDKDIDQVFVEGDASFREARDFMRMLMPSQAKKVQLYREPTPLFVKHRVEDHLSQIYSPVVPLRSGGYLVINQTEALVAVDVNSGRSTRERNIEATALKTNMEAAEEAARQLRLRDLAGLIVIDFIDMDESKNNRSVEKKLKDCLEGDRARVQMGRISGFGLMEISRQRRRTGVLEGTTHVCEHCAGTGRVRSVESSALAALRSMEIEALKGGGEATLKAPRAVGLYILNEKRAHLARLFQAFGLFVTVVIDDDIAHAECQIERTSMETRADHTPIVAPSSAYEPMVDDGYDDEAVEDEDEDEDEE